MIKFHSRKIYLVFFSIFLNFSLFSAAEINAHSRVLVDFNFNWKFYLGDIPEAKNKDFNDTAWRNVNLPHDWSIEQNYTSENTSGSTGFLPAGIGWYRKTFVLDKDKASKLIFIEFDGVYKNAEVWINGNYLGIRPYGYSVFGYDITKYLIVGQENTIAVKVDHSNFADARWYPGSGIYRDVRLVITSDCYIPQFGAWIETPLANTHKAIVSVNAVIRNESKVARKAIVQVDIVNRKGKVVGSNSKPIKVNLQDTLKLDIVINKPLLWSIENTNMYKAEIKIIENRLLKDNYSIDFGIRDIKFSANKGFILNGKQVKLKGVCLHHDAGAVGAAFVKDVWIRRLQRLKDIGVNAIRSSHNPAATGFLKLCDEMGFVVINEAFDEWKRNKEKWITSRFANDMRSDLLTGYGDIFNEWAKRDVKDMVRYSRNHPSIIMWSMGNEIEWTYPYYWKMEQDNQGLNNTVDYNDPDIVNDELKETAIQIQKWIKEIDKTRFVTTGGVLPKAGNKTGYFDVPDVMGYNYRAKNYDSDHKHFPNRVIYGSENWGTYQEWKDATDREFVAGVFLWTGIAYLGESGPFPWKGLELSLLDFGGFYTPRGHFFKTLWNPEPSIYLATKHARKAQWIYKDSIWIDYRVRHWLDKWLFEDVEETWNYANGDSVFVEVYANSPQVELFINNKSCGIKEPKDFSDHIVKYLVPYAAGEIKAEGLNNNKVETEFSIKTATNVSKLVLKADKDTIRANGYDVVHIEAYLTTAKGDVVPDKDAQITFTVEGEGLNIGVDNGWEKSVQNSKSNMNVTHNGHALIYIQSTQKPGDIIVNAKCGKMVSNTIVVKNHLQ